MKKIIISIVLSVLLMIQMGNCVNIQKVNAYYPKIGLHNENIKMMDLIKKYDEMHKTTYGKRASFKSYNRSSFFMPQGSCISYNGKYGFFMLEARAFKNEKDDQKSNEQEIYEFRVSILVIVKMKEDISNNLLEMDYIEAINEFDFISENDITSTSDNNRSKCGHCNSLSYIPDFTIDNKDNIVKCQGKYLLATSVCNNGELEYSFFEPDINVKENKTIKCVHKKVSGYNIDMFGKDKPITSMTLRKMTGDSVNIIIMRGDCWQEMSIPIDKNKICFKNAISKTYNKIDKGTVRENGETLGIQGSTCDRDGKYIYILYSYRIGQEDVSAGRLLMVDINSKKIIAVYDIGGIGKEPESINLYKNSNGNYVMYISFFNSIKGDYERGYRVKITLPTYISYYESSSILTVYNLVNKGEKCVVWKVNNKNKKFKVYSAYYNKYLNGWDLKGKPIWKDKWNGFTVESGQDITSLNTGYRAGIVLNIVK